MGEKRNWVAIVEFWAVTIALANGIVVFMIDFADRQPAGAHETATVFLLLRNIARLVALYAGFLSGNFLLSRLIAQRRYLVSAGIILSALGLFWLVFGSLQTTLVAAAIIASYVLVKHGIVYLISLSRSMQQRYRFLAPGVLLVGVLWLASLIALMAGEADREVIALWVTWIPCALFVYSYSFYRLIPQAKTHRRQLLRYLRSVFVVVLITTIPLSLVTILITHNGDVTSILMTINMVLQLLVTAPVTWLVFRRFEADTDRVERLEQQLGQSTANVDFLRSQINPHFLFNALNMLYGTAMREKSGRTAEGILMLSEMMRFMLRENLQEAIPLAREVDYLRNYIQLQQIRTDAIEGFRIDVDLPENLPGVSLAPMLLIPFVENAFKHGTSFLEPCFISVRLETVRNNIDLQVRNSKPGRSGLQPERDSNGVGLANVRQRLQLFYPGKHELVVRESAAEFFIHLAIQLS